VEANFVAKNILGGQYKRCLRLLPTSFRNPDNADLSLTYQFYAPSKVNVESQELNEVKLKIASATNDVPVKFKKGAFASAVLRFNQVP
jgi:hypothetical protein